MGCCFHMMPQCFHWYIAINVVQICPFVECIRQQAIFSQTGCKIWIFSSWTSGCWCFLKYRAKTHFNPKNLDTRQQAGRIQFFSIICSPCIFVYTFNLAAENTLIQSTLALFNQCLSISSAWTDLTLLTHPPRRNCQTWNIRLRLSLGYMHWWRWKEHGWMAGWMESSHLFSQVVFHGRVEAWCHKDVHIILQ